MRSHSASNYLHVECYMLWHSSYRADRDTVIHLIHRIFSMFPCTKDWIIEYFRLPQKNQSHLDMHRSIKPLNYSWYMRGLKIKCFHRPSDQHSLNQTNNLSQNLTNHLRLCIRMKHLIFCCGLNETSFPRWLFPTQWWFLLLFMHLSCIFLCFPQWS